MRIYTCSISASFLAGVAVALLASYPIEKNSLYVCFWALLAAMAACILGAWAIVDLTAIRERVKVDEVVQVVIEEVLADRRLRSVDKQ